MFFYFQIGRIFHEKHLGPVSPIRFIVMVKFIRYNNLNKAFTDWNTFCNILTIIFVVLDLSGMLRKPRLSSRKRHSSFAKAAHGTPSTVNPEDDGQRMHSTEIHPSPEVCTVGVQTDGTGEIVQATENLLTSVVQSLFVSVPLHYFFKVKVQSTVHLSQLLSSMKCIEHWFVQSQPDHECGALKLVKLSDKNVISHQTCIGLSVYQELGLIALLYSLTACLQP